MTQIVGIGGKLASGKDAIADYLVSEYGWVKFGMSDALADALYTLDPWIVTIKPLKGNSFFKLWRKWFAKEEAFQDIEMIGYAALVDRVGYVEAKTNPEVRRLLQVLGTEVGRKQLSDGDLWTGIMERKINKAVADGAPGVIVTGVRFPNEVELFEQIGADTWWVDRPSLKSTVNAGHASENSVSAVDFELVVRNDGTLEDLYRKVDDLVT